MMEIEGDLESLSERMIKACNSIAPSCPNCSKQTKIYKPLVIKDDEGEIVSAFLFKCPRCKNVCKGEFRQKPTLH